jgi:beta-glucosidase
VLGARTPDDPDPIAAAAQAAKDADTAIVFASDFTTEGADRTSLALPGDENALIQAVADANPHTVVVLNTSSAVTMPWLDKVSAVLESWYPGQQYGTALASLLFGDTNPSGKLPLTFPASDQQGPWGAGTLQYPGDGTNVFYSEGIDVGYRWYDAQHAGPLFPFGSGLSYTSFAFSKPTVRPRFEGSADVSFDITNTGTRAGADVAQVYVGPGPAIPGVQQAVRSLRGFDRVTLEPGQTKHETITLDARSFQYWNSTGQNWATDYGQRTIWVGDSSANLPVARDYCPIRKRPPRPAASAAPCRPACHPAWARPRHSHPASTRRTGRPRRPMC